MSTTAQDASSQANLTATATQATQPPQELKIKKEVQENESKEREQPKRVLTCLEALQIILLLPKGNEHYETAVPVLMKKNELKGMGKLLKSLLKESEVFFSLSKAQITKLPNLFILQPDSHDHAGLIDAIVEINGKTKLTPEVSGFFQNILEKFESQEYPLHIYSMAIFLLLQASYGMDGILLPDKMRDIIKAQIKELISSVDLPEKTRTQAIPPECMLPLICLKKLLHRQDQSDRITRLKAREICEFLRIPIDVPQMITLSIDGVMDDGKSEADDIIIVMGVTSSGKSTVINCAYGTEYEWFQDPGTLDERLIPKPGQYEPARVGHTLHSQTLFSQVVKTSRFVFIDCPGFLHTRDSESACASLGIPLAVHYAKRIRAVIVVIEWEKTKLTGSGKTNDFHSLSHTLSRLFNDVSKLMPQSGKPTILFAISKPPQPLRHQTFDPDALKASLINRINVMLEDSNSRKRELEELESSCLTARAQLVALECSLRELTSFYNQKAITTERSGIGTGFLVSLAGQTELVKDGYIEKLIKDQIQKWQELSISEESVSRLEMALRKIVQKPDNERLSTIEEYRKTWEKEKALFQEEIRNLTKRFEERNGELDILTLLSRSSDNIFIIRGHCDDTRDKPDHLKAMLEYIEELRNQNLVIPKSVFNFDPANIEFEQIRRWAEKFSTENFPNMRGQLDLPKEIDSLNKDIERRKTEIDAYEQELLEKMQLSEDQQRSKLQADLEKHISEKTKIYEAEEHDIRIITQTLLTMKQRLEQIHNEKEIEYGSQYKIEMRFSIIRDSWFAKFFGIATKWQYKFENNRNVFLYDKRNDFWFLEECRIPINRVELSCVVDQNNRLVFKTPISYKKLYTKNGEYLNDLISHAVVSKEVEVRELQDKNMNMILPTKNQTTLTGSFAPKLVNLTEGQLEITYHSTVAKDGYAAVRTFVLPKHTPEYRTRIRELDSNIEVEEKRLKEKQAANADLKYRLDNDIRHLELLKRGLGVDQEPKVSRLQFLLYVLGYTKEDFIKSFCLKELDELNWLTTQGNFNWLVRLASYPASEFEKLSLEMDRKTFRSLLGVTKLPDDLSTDAEKTACIADAPKEYPFFVQKAPNLCKKTGLTIASLLSLMSWNFEGVSGLYTNKSLHEQLMEQKSEKEAVQFCYKKLREIYKRNELRVAALGIISGLLNFEGNFFVERFLQANKELKELKEPQIPDTFDSDLESIHRVIFTKLLSQMNQYGLTRSILLSENNTSQNLPNLEINDASQALNPKIALTEKNSLIKILGLGICDQAEKGKLSQATYRELCIALAIDKKNVENKDIFLSWLQKHSSEECQKILVPVLKKICFNYIEENYERYKDYYEHELYGAFYKYCLDNMDPIYCVHDFIRKKFKDVKQRYEQRKYETKDQKEAKELKETKETKEGKETKEVLERTKTRVFAHTTLDEKIKQELCLWWKEEGKKQFFSNLGQVKELEEDLRIWDDVILDSLAHKFGITIKNRKNGAQIIFGSGFGILEGLDKTDAEHLFALQIGSHYQGNVRINISDRKQLEKILNLQNLSELERKRLDDSGKTAVLAFRNERNKIVSIPGIENMGTFCTKLETLGALRYFQDKTGRLKARFANSNELDYLAKPISVALKQKVLSTHRTDISSFELSSDKGVWSYNPQQNKSSSPTLRSEKNAEKESSNFTKLSTIKTEAYQILTKLLYASELITNVSKGTAELKGLAEQELITYLAFDSISTQPLLLISGKGPSNLEERYVPAIVRKEDRTFRFIINTNSGIKKIKAPKTVNIKAIEEFFEANKAQGKVFLSWSHPVMKLLMQIGHTPKNKVMQFVKAIFDNLKGSQMFPLLTFQDGSNWLHLVTKISWEPLLKDVDEAVRLLQKMNISPYARNREGYTCFHNIPEGDPAKLYTLLAPSSVPNFFGVDKQVKDMMDFLEKIKKDPGVAGHFLLLSGPSGVGKTELIKLTSKNAGFELRQFPRGDQNDMWVGQLEKRVQDFFEAAKKSNQPICLFMDEIDSICPQKSEHHASGYNPDRIVTLMQMEISNLKGSRVVLVGATNYLHSIKTEIKNRAGVPIMFSLPVLEERRKIIEYQLRLERIKEVSVIPKIAAATSGWSPRLLTEYLFKVSNKAELAQQAVLSTEDFVDSFEAMRKQLMDELNHAGVILEAPKLKIQQPTDFSAGLVALNQKVKQQLGIICDFLENPSRYSYKNKNLLLVGPPGTGKTLFAKTIANYSNTVFLYINAGKIKTTGSHSLHKTFEVAGSFERAVIFIDEIDAIGHEHSPFKESLQTLIQGFEERRNNNSLVVIGACNYPDHMADAVMARFDTVVVPFPNEAQRAELFEFFIKSIKNIKASEELSDLKAVSQTLAGLSPNFAGRDIGKAVDRANETVAYLQGQQTTKDSSRLLTLKDLKEACSEQLKDVERRLNKPGHSYPREFFDELSADDINLALDEATISHPKPTSILKALREQQQQSSGLLSSTLLPQFKTQIKKAEQEKAQIALETKNALRLEKKGQDPSTG